MAISIYRLANDYNDANHKEFLLDTDSDVSALPGIENCSAGSVALVIDSGNFYILSRSGQWKLI